MANKLIHSIRFWLYSPPAPAQATVFFAALLAGSMPLSPFMLSISMWGLVFVAFWHRMRETPAAETPPPAPPLKGRGEALRQDSRRCLSEASPLAFRRRAGGGVSFGWKQMLVVLANSFHRLFRQRVYAVFLLLLLVPALSGLWSNDHAYWLERTRVRLPFLVLPWAFANLPVLSRRQYEIVLYILVWWMAILCIGVGINFALHKTEIMHAMYQGRPMPVPRHHIRFSLMVATAVLAGAWLWQQRFVWRYARERVALGAATVLLFAFMHFLSVRSGLFALYAALLFAAARYIWQTRRWGLALGILAFLLAAPWVAVNTLPSLKQKFEYTLYDWGRYRQDEGETYSDAERWVSLKTGWRIWLDHPWLGAGAGDLPAETNRVLAAYFPHYLPTPKLPHNQFLYILAGTGIFGLALSLLAFLYPLVCTHNYRHYLFAAFQVMIFASFLVEYTVETAMGVAWYLFYTLWFLRLRLAG